jgi:hypothetical protein
MGGSVTSAKENPVYWTREEVAQAMHVLGIACFPDYYTCKTNHAALVDQLTTILERLEKTSPKYNQERKVS